MRSVPTALATSEVYFVGYPAAMCVLEADGGARSVKDPALYDPYLYLNDVYITAPHDAIANTNSTRIAGTGHLTLFKEYAHADQGTNSGTSAGHLLSG